MLTEVYYNVATEPSLQPIISETFSLASANTTNDACLDVKARGFWSRGQDAYFDVTPMLPVTTSLALLLFINTMRMQRSDNTVIELIRDIEHGIFTPLVITSTGSMRCEATVFYRRLADLLVTHWGQEYSQTIKWLRCCLSFALLRCAILVICRGRFSTHHPVLGPLDLSVVLAESRLTN